MTENAGINIPIKVTGMNEALSSFALMQQMIGKLGGRQETASQKATRVADAHADSIDNQMLSQQSWNDSVDSSIKKSMKYDESMAKLTKEGKKFKMEFLGVMFMGMAMQKTFSEMTKGAFSMLGITEMLTGALDLMALEGLMGVNDQMYEFIDNLYEMSKAEKQSVGEGMLMGQAMGTIMSTVGQLVLGLSSLALAFPGAIVPIGAALASVLGKMAPLLAAVPGFEGLGPIFADMFKEIETPTRPEAFQEMVMKPSINAEHMPASWRKYFETGELDFIPTVAKIGAETTGVGKVFFGEDGLWTKGEEPTGVQIDAMTDLISDWFDKDGNWLKNNVVTSIDFIPGGLGAGNFPSSIVHETVGAAAIAAGSSAIGGVAETLPSGEVVLNITNYFDGVTNADEIATIIDDKVNVTLSSMKH